jgi:hypothetical protein
LFEPLLERGMGLFWTCLLIEDGFALDEDSFRGFMAGSNYSVAF